MFHHPRFILLQSFVAQGDLHVLVPEVHFTFVELQFSSCLGVFSLGLFFSFGIVAQSIPSSFQLMLFVLEPQLSRFLQASSSGLFFPLASQPSRSPRVFSPCFLPLSHSRVDSKLLAWAFFSFDILAQFPQAFSSRFLSLSHSPPSFQLRPFFSFDILAQPIPSSIQLAFFVFEPQLS